MYRYKIYNYNAIVFSNHAMLRTSVRSIAALREMLLDIVDSIEEGDDVLNIPVLAMGGSEEVMVVNWFVDQNGAFIPDINNIVVDVLVLSRRIMKHLKHLKKSKLVGKNNYNYRKLKPVITNLLEFKRITHM